MFKIICFTALCFLSLGSFAQINRGSLLLGTEISYEKSTSKTQSGTGMEQKAFRISPSIAVSVKPNLIAGIDISYYGFELEYSNYLNHIKDIGGGLFVRPYKPVSSNFLVFVQGRLGYTHIDREEGYAPNPSGRSFTDGSIYNLTLMPGVSYKAGKSVLFELGVNNLLKIEVENSGTTSATAPKVTNKAFRVSSAAADFPLSFGVRFIL